MNIGVLYCIIHACCAIYRDVLAYKISIQNNVTTLQQRVTIGKHNSLINNGQIIYLQDNYYISLMRLRKLIRYNVWKEQILKINLIVQVLIVNDNMRGKLISLGRTSAVLALEHGVTLPPSVVILHFESANPRNSNTLFYVACDNITLVTTTPCLNIFNIFYFYFYQSYLL